MWMVKEYGGEVVWPDCSGIPKPTHLSEPSIKLVER
jgi:hypothetical protein